MYNETVLAILGHVTVNTSFDVYESAGDSAYMTRTVRVKAGQTVPIEFVSGSERYVRVRFEGTIVDSWDRSQIGSESGYFWSDRSTWDLAKLALSGWGGKCTVTLAPGYMVAQHEDIDGPRFYSPAYLTGEIVPMRRIVLSENKAPIGWRMSYPSRSGVDGWWYESFM